MAGFFPRKVINDPVRPRLTLETIGAGVFLALSAGAGRSQVRIGSIWEIRDRLNAEIELLTPKMLKDHEEWLEMMAGEEASR